MSNNIYTFLDDSAVDCYNITNFMGIRIGFIGQGFIGKHMADDFENRGYDIVRYALDPPYDKNKDALKTCEIVFIAVPTPTHKQKFDYSIIEKVLGLLEPGTIAVIKSTILPGTTETLQQKYPKLYVMHSPEFLREKSAAEDTAKPERNIIGTAKESKTHNTRAHKVLSVLPKAPYELITTARTAECIKYIGNTFLHTKIVFMNIAYDFVQAAEGSWEHVREAVGNDSRIGHSHTHPVHESGRGAGGHCFIKDFEAFLQYTYAHADQHTTKVLEAIRDKNNQLLLSTQKDLELLEGVYGRDYLDATLK